MGEPASDTAPAVPDVMRTNMLVGFADLVIDLGGDADALLAEVGLSVSDSALSGGPTTYRQYFGSLELAVRRLSCPDFGMRLAVRQEKLGIVGRLGAVMQHSATLGDSIRYSSEHIHAHNPSARVWIERRGEEGIFVGHDILLDHGIGQGQGMEQLLLLASLLARKLTGGEARARRIYLRRPPNLSPKVYNHYFGCDVLFNQRHDGVLYFDRDFAAPMIGHDRLRLAHAVDEIEAELGPAEQRPLHVEVRGLILHHLGTELCTQDHVAAEFHIHKRMLHRRLVDAGTSFRLIKDLVQRDVALHLLEETDLDLTQIAARLGFAEQSVLSRRCKQWFAATPSELRSRNPRLALTDSDR